jgi:hypothetical protein
MISITTAANIEIGTITTTIPTLVSLYIINHVALYIIRKAADYRTTLKKNKKSLKLNLKPPTETSLVNLITNLIKDLINIL